MLDGDPFGRKEVRQARRLLGTCVYCGTEPASPRRASCATCREGYTRRTRAHRKKASTDGICIYCRERPADGTLLGCSGCLESRRALQAARRVRLGDCPEEVALAACIEKRVGAEQLLKRATELLAAARAAEAAARERLADAAAAAQMGASRKKLMRAIRRFGDGLID